MFEDGTSGTRFTWTVAVLPNETYISAQMDLGTAAMRKALARKAA